MPESTPPVTYQLKIVLIGISPMIWRQIKVSSDSTIADLHYITSSRLLWVGKRNIYTNSLFIAYIMASITLAVEVLWAMLMKSNYPNLVSEKEKNSATNMTSTAIENIRLG